MAELEYEDSIGGLIKGIIADLRQLIRDELALARVEMREQAAHARMAAILLAAAGVTLALGGAFLLIALAIGIADVLGWPVWAGFLVLAVVLGLGGIVMLGLGRRRLRAIHGVPEQTLATLKENSEWLAKRLSSARK